MSDTNSFSGWLRGFMDGVGSAALTLKQIQKIIENAQEALGTVDAPINLTQRDLGVRATTPEPMRAKLSRSDIAALGKNPKNNGAPKDPDFGVPLPTVERQE